MMSDPFAPRFVQLERHEMFVPILGPVKYTIEAKGRVLKWLVDELIKYGVLKVSLPEERIETAFIDPSEKELLEKIMEAIHDSKLSMKGGNMRFVIGASDYHSKEFHDVISFNAGPFYTMNNGHREIYGIPVQVVPWMKGWAVIPDDMEVR